MENDLLSGLSEPFHSPYTNPYGPIAIGNVTPPIPSVTDQHGSKSTSLDAIKTELHRIIWPAMTLLIVIVLCLLLFIPTSPASVIPPNVHRDLGTTLGEKETYISALETIVFQTASGTSVANRNRELANDVGQLSDTDLLERGRITVDGRMGFGTQGPQAKWHIESKTESEHVRIAYDKFNYASLSVSDTGGLSMKTIGSLITVEDVPLRPIHWMRLSQLDQNLSSDSHPTFAQLTLAHTSDASSGQAVLKTSSTGSFEVETMDDTFIFDGTFIDSQVWPFVASMDQHVSIASSPTFAGLTINGDLVVNGTTTTVTSTNLEITDAFIKIARANTTTSLDMGLYGQYDSPTTKYTGFFRDGGTGTWYLFDNVTTEPTSGFNPVPSNAYLGTLQVYQFSADSISATASFETADATPTFSGLGQGIAHLSSGGVLSSSTIVNADIDAAAGIVDTKLATISTAGKVSNSATTATSANTASAIVARDASGNFSAGTVSADLTGTVLTAAQPNITSVGILTSFNTTAASPKLSHVSFATPGVLHMIAGGIISNSLLVNADVSSSAALSWSKLADATGIKKVLGSSTAANTVSELSLGTGLDIVGSTLDTIQGITTSSSPTFAGLTLTAFSGVVKASAGVLSASTIVNADIDAAAGIVDTKLATISTAGKVSNSATTATSANTASAIVARDASGNFNATGVICSAVQASSTSATYTPVGSFAFNGALSGSNSALRATCTNNVASVYLATQATAKIQHPVSIGGSYVSNMCALYINTPSSVSTTTTIDYLAGIYIEPQYASAIAAANNYASIYILTDAGPIWSEEVNPLKFPNMSVGYMYTNGSSGVSASTTIPSTVVNFSATGRLLGRTTAGSGVGEEISVGASLSLSALTLDTIQAITTSSSPTFAGLTLTAFSGVVKASAGVLSASSIVNADIDAAAGIVDTKLATISTAGKVSNSATTATSSNMASAIVARDASGNFSAGRITCTSTTSSPAGSFTSNGSNQSDAYGISALASPTVSSSISNVVSGRFIQPHSLGGNLTGMLCGILVATGSDTTTTQVYDYFGICCKALNTTTRAKVTDRVAAIFVEANGGSIWSEEPSPLMFPYFGTGLLYNDGVYGNPVAPVSIGSSLSISSSTLNTIQAITTSSSPTFAGLTLSNATQSVARLTLTGQEFYQAGYTSTDGIAFLIGVNRSGNRQLWIADSAALTPNTTNAVCRITPVSGQVYILAHATDGNTALPIELGVSSALTTIQGTRVQIPAGAAATPSLAFNSSTTTGLWASGNATLGFSVGGTERMRMNSSGQILIGTSSALASSTLLQVHRTGENCYIEVTGDSAYQQAVRLNDGTTTWIMYKPGSTSDLRFYSGAVGDVLTLKNSTGQVVIGSASAPNSNSVLHISKANNLYFCMEESSYSTTGIAVSLGEVYYANQVGGFHFRTGTTYNGDWTSTGTELLTIASTGSVQIPYGNNSFGFSKTPALTLGSSGGTKAGSLYLYGTTGNALLQCTINNLHLDCSGIGGVYLNYYSGTGGTVFGNGASGLVASINSSGQFTGYNMTLDDASFTATLTAWGAWRNTGIQLETNQVRSISGVYASMPLTLGVKSGGSNVTAFEVGDNYFMGASKLITVRATGDITKFYPVVFRKRINGGLHVHNKVTIKRSVHMDTDWNGIFQGEFEWNSGSWGSQYPYYRAVYQNSTGHTYTRWLADIGWETLDDKALILWLRGASTYYVTGENVEWIDIGDYSSYFHHYGLVEQTGAGQITNIAVSSNVMTITHAGSATFTAGDVFIMNGCVTTTTYNSTGVQYPIDRFTVTPFIPLICTATSTGTTHTFRPIEGDTWADLAPTAQSAGKLFYCYGNPGNPVAEPKTSVLDEFDVYTYQYDTRQSRRIQLASSGAGADTHVTWKHDNSYILGKLSTDPTSYNSGAITLLANGSNAVFITANGSSYFNGGSVGIGTSTPLAKLSFGTSGAANSTASQIALYENGGQQFFYGFGIAGSSNYEGVAVYGGTGSVVPTATTPHIFCMRDDASGSGGRVGIKTIAPEASLHVNGTNFTLGGAATSDSQQLLLNVGSGYSGVEALRQNHAYNVLALQATDVMGTVSVGTTLTSAKFNVAGSGVFGASYAGVYTPPSNGILVQGAVGVGLDSNSARSRLDLGHTASGATGADLAMLRIGSYMSMGHTYYSNWGFIGINCHLATSNGSGNTFEPAYSPGTGLLIAQDGGGNGSLRILGRNWNSNATPIDISAMTDIMYLKYSGEVGIGTASPSEKFQVNNGRMYLYMTGDSPAVLQLGNTSSLSYIFHGYSGDFPNDLVLRPNVGKTVISSNAYVSGTLGVGTLASRPLTVKDTDNSTAQICMMNSSTTGTNAYMGTFSNAVYLSVGGKFASGAWSYDSNNYPVPVFTMVTSSGDSYMTWNVGSSNGSIGGEKMRLKAAGELLLPAGVVQGYDENHSIYFRAAGLDQTFYYSFGGTSSDARGHRFMTGGGKDSQAERLRISNDVVSVINSNLAVNTTSVTSGYVMEVNGAIKHTSAPQGGQFYYVHSSEGTWNDYATGTLNFTTNNSTWTSLSSASISNALTADTGYVTMSNGVFTIVKAGLYALFYTVNYTMSNGYGNMVVVMKNGSTVVNGTKMRHSMAAAASDTVDANAHALVSAAASDTFELKAMIATTNGTSPQTMYVSDLTFSMVFLRP